MPTTLTPPPAAPQASDDRSTFKVKAFALMAWFATMVSEMTAALADVFNWASNAQASALAAASSAATAGALSSAAFHVPATNYAAGTIVRSNVNYLAYIRTTVSPGVNATDPALEDTGRWAPAGTPPIVVADVSGAITAMPFGWYCFTGAGDLTLPAAPQRGDIVNVCKSGSYTVTVLRNGNPMGSVADDRYLGTAGIWYAWMYRDSTIGWALIVN